MPIYEYKCSNCDTLESRVKPASHSDSEEICKICNTSLKRVYSSVGVSFNGSGFYTTDK